MEAILNEAGVLFVKGAKNPPSYLIRSTKSDWYWSSWRWIPKLREEWKEWNEFNFKGADRYEQLKNIDDRLVAAAAYKLKGDEEYPPCFKEHFTLDLWPAQMRAAMLMVAAKRYYLADDVGLGKTLSSIAALVFLRSKGLFKSALVVTTTSVKYQWRLEILKAIKKEYRGAFEVEVIDGAPSDRLRMYASSPAQIKIVGYETLYRDLKNGAVMYPNVVILDEAWKIKSYTSKTRRELKKAFKDTEYRFVLNASPVGNGFEDIFGIFDWLDPTVFLTWKTFDSRYCTYKTIVPKNGGPTFRIPLGYRRVPEMRQMIAPMLLRRQVSDMGWKSPMVTVTPYYVDLLDSQRAQYTALAKDQTTNPLAKTTKARQICLMTDSVALSPKYKMLLELLKENLAHEKVIVFTESRVFVEGAVELLKKEGVRVSSITGEHESEERTVIQTNFTHGKIAVLIMTSAGEAGLNLQAADVVVNLDLPWNPERLRQRVGRLRPHLGGENRHIRVINILARTTIEEKVIEAINSKIGDFKKIFSTEDMTWAGTFNEDFLASLM